MFACIVTDLPIAPTAGKVNEKVAIREATRSSPQMNGKTGGLGAGTKPLIRQLEEERSSRAQHADWYHSYRAGRRDPKCLRRW